MRFIVLLLAPCLAGCANQDHAKCLSYGAQPGTPGYLQCRMQLEQRRQNAIADFQFTPVVPAAPAPRPSVSCTSTVVGNQINTNC